MVLNDGSDNADVLARYSGKTVSSATLQGRTLWKNGLWNTLCLPFSLTSLEGTPLEGAKVKELSKSSFADGTLTLTFSDDLRAIEAGKPYIVKWVNAEQTEDIESPVFEGVTVRSNTTASSTTCVDFSGAFSPVILTAGNQTTLYMGSDNKLYYPEADMTVGACRALFLLKNGLTAGDFGSAASSSVRTFVLNFGDGDTVSVDEVSSLPAASEESAGAWYDLQGRRLSGKPSVNGLYINNGKIVIINL